MGGFGGAGWLEFKLLCNKYSHISSDSWLSGADHSFVLSECNRLSINLLCPLWYSKPLVCHQFQWSGVVGCRKLDRCDFAVCPPQFIAKTRCLITCRSVYGGDFKVNLGHLGSLFIRECQLLASSLSHLRLFWAHTISATGLWGRSQSDTEPLGT